MPAYVFPFGCIFATVVSLILPGWSQFIMHRCRMRLATISRPSRTSRLCVLFFVGSPTSANVVHSVGRAEVSVAFMTCASSVRPDYRTRLQRYYEELVLSKFFRNFFHFLHFSFSPVTISLSAMEKCLDLALRTGGTAGSVDPTIENLPPPSTWQSPNKR